MSDKQTLHREQEIFPIPFVPLGFILGVPYNVSDFQILSYGARKFIDSERIFWN